MYIHVITFSQRLSFKRFIHRLSYSFCTLFHYFRLKIIDWCFSITRLCFRSDQFQCKSGQCIKFEDKCNGIYECADQSDEIKETCLNIQCPGFTYKCDYGACVDGDSRCNGVKNCVDNSDENNCMTTTSKPITVTPLPTGPQM